MAVATAVEAAEDSTAAVVAAGIMVADSVGRGAAIPAAVTTVDTRADITEVEATAVGEVLLGPPEGTDFPRGPAVLPARGSPTVMLGLARPRRDGIPSKVAERVLAR